MTNSLREIYTHHHAHSRERGFSILKEERGALLKELVGKGKKVLDMGCRDGTLTKYFIEGNQVLGLDIDQNTLNEAAKLGIETKIVDLNGEWLELNGRKFDVIVAGEVLEHLYYPEKVAARTAEHLLPGGQFIGSVPNAFSLKNRLRYLFGSKRYTPLSDPTHITQFNVSELEIILKKYFRQVKIIGLGRYQKLAKFSPNLFSFDLFFVAEK